MIHLCAVVCWRPRLNGQSRAGKCRDGPALPDDVGHSNSELWEVEENWTNRICLRAD